MKNDGRRGEGVARAARQMAQTGKFDSILGIETALIMQGHPVGRLQDTHLRAELQMWIEDARRNEGI